MLSPLFEDIMEEPIKTKFNYDHNEDKVILENVQDIEPLLELNKKNLTRTIFTVV